MRQIQKRKEETYAKDRVTLFHKTDAYMRAVQRPSVKYKTHQGYRDFDNICQLSVKTYPSQEALRTHTLHCFWVKWYKFSMTWGLIYIFGNIC